MRYDNEFSLILIHKLVLHEINGIIVTNEPDDFQLFEVKKIVRVMLLSLHCIKNIVLISRR